MTAAGLATAAGTVPARGHVAASDCERCRPGLVGQPVNTASSLAFVAAGAAMVAADRGGGGYGTGSGAEAAVGWAAVAAGLGSVAYHGPGTAAGRYVHDVSLVALLAAVVVADVSRIRRRPAPPVALAAVPVLALAGAVPRWSTIAQASVGVAAAVAESVRIASIPSSRAGRWRHRAEGVVTATGALAHVLGRSGGPWCRPDSLVQPHALWHAAMATALGLRALDPPA